MRRVQVVALVCLLLSLAPPVALAEDFVVEDIRLEGLQRVSAGAVFSVLPLGVGERTSAGKLREIIRAVFATGNFNDVRLKRDGNVLVLQLEERPFISEITISGNQAIKPEDLLEGLNDAGIAAGQVLKRATLEGIRQELRRQYSSRGRYDSDVRAEIEEQPRNRVAIELMIDEGRPARIRRISIIGNTVFSDRELLEDFESRTASGFSFLSKRGQYSRETLGSDLERLEARYRNRGYARFSIPSAQVSVTPDRRSVYVNIVVAEGEVYTVEKVTVSGTTVLPRETLQRFLRAREGELYSEQAVTGTEELLKAVFNNAGYFDAEVRGVPEIDDEEHSVRLRFFCEPGPRTYVRRIEFTGHHGTDDAVLRREMRQMEGAPASRQAIDASRLRLERLGFFRGVEVDTLPVPGSEDEVDVVVEAEEEFSGSLQFSLGYSETYNLLYRFLLERRNFFGTGRTVRIDLRENRASSVYGVRLFNPYFTRDGVSQSLDIYHQERDLDEISITRYATTGSGVSLGFGYPISETEQLSFAIGYSTTEIISGTAPVREIRRSPLPYSDLQPYYCELDARGFCTSLALLRENDPLLLYPEPGFLDEHGEDYENWLFNLSWRQYRLNRGQLANRGYEQNFSMEWSLPGSDLEYYKLHYSVDYFRPLNQTFTLRLKAALRYGDGYGDTERLPFYENFFAGGQNTVRGYETSTLGPRSTPALRYQTIRIDDDSDPGTPPREAYLRYHGEDRLATEQVFFTDEPDPFGGNFSVVGNVELLFALPFVPDPRTVRSGFFFDIGNVFDTGCGATQLGCQDFDAGEFRYSLGFGLVWLTALGPLRFNFARPFNSADYDEEDTFEFSLGTGFGF